MPAPVCSDVFPGLERKSYQKNVQPFFYKKAESLLSLMFTLLCLFQGKKLAPEARNSICTYFGEARRMLTFAPKGNAIGTLITYHYSAIT